MKLETIEHEIIDPELPDNEQPGGAPSTPAKPDPVAEELKTLRRELENTRRTAKEHAENAKFWAAKAGATPPTAQQSQAEPEVKVTVDLLDAITNNDPKALKQAMKEMGFVSAAEVQEYIGQTRNEITEEAKLANRFPDLFKEGEFQNEALAEASRLQARFPKMNQAELIEMGAELVDAKRGGGSTKPQPKPRTDQTDWTDDDEDDADRAARISSQGAGAGDRVRQGSDAEDFDPLQAAMFAKFKQHSPGLTIEGMKKRFKTGVAFAGKAGRR